MKKILKKVFFFSFLICLLLGTNNTNTSAAVVAVRYEFDVQYVDTRGNIIDASHNYVGVMDNAGDFSPTVINIPNYTYSGYYYTNSLNANNQGSLTNLLTTNPPVVSTLIDQSDAYQSFSNYTVYMVYNSTSVEASYTIRYDANGGTGTLSDPNNPYLTGVVISVLDGSSLTKDGFTFEGWNTVADGSGASYKPNDEITIGTNDITLYAQWKKVEDNTVVPSNTIDTPNTVAPSNTTNIPNTGDYQSASLYALGIFLSLVGLVFLVKKGHPSR